MNDDGSEIIAAERPGYYVEPMEGIFVKAECEDDSVTFSTNIPSKGHIQKPEPEQIVINLSTLNYLYLIDNMTGADIDLLASPNYTFTANTTDYESRFHLVFSVGGDADGDNEDAPFAFISNGEIIVVADAGTASLQVVDVMGHVIVCRDAARHVSTAGMTAGVYVLRLIDGDTIRTQKIVIE